MQKGLKIILSKEERKEFFAKNKRHYVLTMGFLF
jgi:hypothetical protein